MISLNFRTKFRVRLDKPSVVRVPLDLLDVHTLLSLDAFAYKRFKRRVIFEKFCSFRLLFGSHCEKCQSVHIRFL